MNEVFAFEVSVVDRDWNHIVNARTPGAAKAEYHRQVTDVWPDIPFTAIRCRKLGAPHTSEQFQRCAAYRGLADLKCGQRVNVGEACGVIVGHNDSANFDVLFDDDSPKYPGQTLNCHPSGITII